MTAKKYAKSQEKLAATRSEAIRNAERIVVDEGLGGLSARRVAALTGCSVGTLYNLFGHLDGLVDEVNQITMRAMLTGARETLQAQPQEAGREIRLAALAAMYLAYAHDNPNRWRAVFEHRPANPAHGRREELQKLIFAHVISAAGINPASANDAEADSLRMLLAAVHGVVAFTLDQTIERVEAERYINVIVKAGVRGYRDLIKEGLI